MDNSPLGKFQEEFNQRAFANNYSRCLCFGQSLGAIGFRLYCNCPFIYYYYIHIVIFSIYSLIIMSTWIHSSLRLRLLVCAVRHSE